MADQPTPDDDKPTCGQPEWHHDPFYCGRGCPWWIGEDDQEVDRG